jgi:secreted trypsin-like serine protease
MLTNYFISFQSFVLTASHCYVQSGNPRDWPKIVRLGALNLKTQSDSIKDAQIQKFILHENYNRKAKKNDVALIQLTQAVP